VNVPACPLRVVAPSTSLSRAPPPRAPAVFPPPKLTSFSISKIAARWFSSRRRSIRPRPPSGWASGWRSSCVYLGGGDAGKSDPRLSSRGAAGGRRRKTLFDDTAPGCQGHASFFPQPRPVPYLDRVIEVGVGRAAGLPGGRGGGGRVLSALRRLRCAGRRRDDSRPGARQRRAAGAARLARAAAGEDAQGGAGGDAHLLRLGGGVGRRRRGVNGAALHVFCVSSV